jgi:hypothetical protein
MAATTYAPLANVTLASSTATVIFGSLPQNYRDLVLVIFGLPAAGSGSPLIRFNNDSGANYGYQAMGGNGSGFNSTGLATGDNKVNVVYNTGFNTVGRACQITLNIMDYSTRDKHKAALVRSDQAAAGTDLFINRWTNIDPITSISMTLGADNWAAGSTFALYGVIA